MIKAVFCAWIYWSDLDIENLVQSFNTILIYLTKFSIWYKWDTLLYGTFISVLLAQSAGGVEYTDCTSAEE